MNAWRVCALGLLAIGAVALLAGAVLALPLLAAAAIVFLVAGLALVGYMLSRQMRHVIGQQERSLEALARAEAALQGMAALRQSSGRLETAVSRLAGIEGALAGRIQDVVRSAAAARAEDSAARRVDQRDISRQLADLQGLVAEHRELLGAQGLDVQTSLRVGRNVLRISKEIAEHQPVESRLRRNLEKAVNDASGGVTRSVEALMQLHALPGAGLSPLLGGWAMEPVAVHALLDVISQWSGPRVVELGSGTSTVWIARMLKSMGAGRVDSLDHERQYAEATRRALEREGLQAWAQVHHAPIVDVEVGDEVYPWYSLADAALPETIDVLVVDGPPAALGEWARFPALPALAARLRQGSVLVIDDAGRPDEAEIIGCWRDLACVQLAEPVSLGPRTVALTVLSNAPD